MPAGKSYNSTRVSVRPVLKAAFLGKAAVSQISSVSMSSEHADTLAGKAALPTHNSVQDGAAIHAAIEGAEGPDGG